MLCLSITHGEGKKREDNKKTVEAVVSPAVWGAQFLY
jgi:hypothetical protein